MHSVLAVALLLATAAVVIESRSFVKPLPNHFLDHWKTRRMMNAGTRSKRDACTDAHQAESSDQFGECESTLAKSLTNTQVSNSDMTKYCQAAGSEDNCGTYLYNIETKIEANCPTDPGLPDDNFLNAVKNSCDKNEKSVVCLAAWNDFEIKRTTNFTLTNLFQSCAMLYRQYGCIYECQQILPWLINNIGCCYYYFAQLFTDEIDVVPLAAFDVCDGLKAPRKCQ